MFALLLSDKMDPFYQNIASFPTAIFTFFLLLSVLFWLVAVLGFIDIDVFDIDMGDADTGTPDVLAGLMLRLGLQGVPVTIIVSLITLFAWLICYYSVYLLFPFLPSKILHYLAGIPIALAATYSAALITAQLIKPLRPLFKNAQQQTIKHIIGQTAIVRSSKVNQRVGEAIMADGGAGLLLKVRSQGEQTFSKGDTVVLLQHEPTTNIYTVISEQEFIG